MKLNAKSGATLAAAAAVLVHSGSSGASDSREQLQGEVLRC